MVLMYCLAPLRRNATVRGYGTVWIHYHEHVDLDAVTLYSKNYNISFYPHNKHRVYKSQWITRMRPVFSSNVDAQGNWRAVSRQFRPSLLFIRLPDTGFEVWI